MLETILAIAGKPGLYKLVSRGNRSLIVESIDDKHHRMPAFATDRVISLADIAMYSDTEEVPLADILTSMKKKEKGAVCSLDCKKASKEQLFDYFAEILPNFDRDRVHPSDVKKLIQWYDILIGAGLDDFSKMAPTVSTYTSRSAAPAASTATSTPLQERRRWQPTRMLCAANSKDGRQSLRTST